MALAFTRFAPVGGASQPGSFSGSLGSFSSGVATSSTLSWTEVGTGDLTATLSGNNYLATGLTATGSTGAAGAVGPFIPNHFTVTVTPACAGSFTYAGQPFGVNVLAMNAAGNPTANFYGSFAQAVTLSDANALGVGTLSGHTIAAAAFAGGVASATPTYTFTAKETGYKTLSLRASNGLAGASLITSSAPTEGATVLRSGRLRLSTAAGKATAALQMAVTAEVWSNSSWVLNSDDSCSSVPAASVALSNPLGGTGLASTATTSASAITLSGGRGVLSLAAPTPAGSGLSVDVALNLGSGAADQSCLASHPASTGAGLAWLRSRHGSCAATFDRDPAARATFGIFVPEQRRTVYIRDVF